MSSAATKTPTSPYEELPADKREALDELVARMLEEPRVRESGVTEAELRDRLAGAALERMQQAPLYGDLPLRTRQAILALLHAQQERPGPKTSAEICARDYDSPSVRGTAAALSSARQAGFVDGAGGAWWPTELAREQVDDRQLLYDELALVDGAETAAAAAGPVPPAIDADGRRPQPGQLAAAEVLEGVPVVEVLDTGGLADVAAGVARRSGSPATRKTYAATYRQLVAFAGPGAGPEILTEPFVAAFRDHLEHRGLSPATVARHLSAVRELVRAVGGPGAVDALAVKSSPVQKGEPRPLTEQQATVLLAMPDRRTTRGIRDAAMLQLLVDAGVRREELVKLTVSSIEETRRHATAVRSAIATSTSWSLRIRGKRGKERLVPLTAAATSALRAWVDRRPVSTSDALFLSIPRHAGQTPDALSTTAVWKMVKKYAKAAGLPDDIAPHRLRHTFGTRHAEADARLDVLQNLLGHSDPRTTMIYARRRADAAAEAIAAVEASQLPANRL